MTKLVPTSRRSSSIPQAPSRVESAMPSRSPTVGGTLQLERAEQLGHHIRNVATPGAIQTKLTLGPADDAYEREADQVAAEVTRQLDSAPTDNAPTDNAAAGGTGHAAGHEAGVQRMDDLDDDTLSAKRGDELSSLGPESHGISLDGIQRADDLDDDMLSAQRVDGIQRMDEMDDDMLSAQRVEGIQRMDDLDDDMLSAKRVEGSGIGTIQRQAAAQGGAEGQAAQAEIPVMREDIRRTIQRREIQRREIQRMGGDEEDQLTLSRVDGLQRKDAVQRDTIQRDAVQRDAVQRDGEGGPLTAGNTLDGGPITDNLESQIQSSKGAGKGLDESVQAPMEQAFGTSFEGVNVHTDSQADTLNRDLDARAFTTGSDIFFRQGEYKPDSQDGKSLLAHELTHVVQQGGGEG